MIDHFDPESLVHLVGPITPFMVDAYLGPEKHRKHHIVRTPKPPEFLAARAEFTLRWEAIRSEGLAAGFLREYDEEGYDTNLAEDDTDDEVRFDETEDEWHVRVEELRAKAEGMRVRTAAELPPGSIFLSNDGYGHT